VGGAASVNNIFTGAAVTSGLNATFDVATGNVPDIQNATDVFKYVGTETVKGLAAAKIGSSVGKYIGPQLEKLAPNIKKWFTYAYEGVDQGGGEEKIGEVIYKYTSSPGIKRVKIPLGNNLTNFTKNNFRKNLIKETGYDPGKSAQAHHVFPQTEEFSRFFNSKGIDVHNPKFGSWWESTSHNRNWSDYNAGWRRFIETNQNAHPNSVLDFGKQIMSRYGLKTNY
jgi:Predicted lipoprotein of unknown function (DUF2380)